MKEIELLYHKKTNTYWVNVEDWKDKYKTEGLKYGGLQMHTDSHLAVKRVMEMRGFTQTYGVENLILRGGQKWLVHGFGW